MWAPTTSCQLPVLIAVCENERLNKNDVVKRTGINGATLGGMIPRLLRKGLLRRQRSWEDARAKVLHPTDQGSNWRKPPGRREGTLMPSCVPPCPPRKRKPFLASLQAIVRNQEAARNPRGLS